jgi:hypothetical protein
MRYLKGLALLPVALLWVWIDMTFEPFKSHIWLTILCGGITWAVLALGWDGLRHWLSHHKQS